MLERHAPAAARALTRRPGGFKNVTHYTGGAARNAYRRPACRPATLHRGARPSRRQVDADTMRVTVETGISIGDLATLGTLLERGVFDVHYFNRRGSTTRFGQAIFWASSIAMRFCSRPTATRRGLPSGLASTSA